MTFIIKKILGALLMPMTLIFLLIFTGLTLVWFSKRWNTAGKIIVTSSVCILFLVCFSPLSSSLMQSLEKTYPVFDQKDISADYIWVLGSGSAYDTTIPLHSRLYQDGLYRVLEGIRLHQMIPETHMVFSGYGAGDIKSVAEVGAEAAISLGVSKEHITILSNPKDTWDEALEAKAIIKDKPFILVTSASHMKRSIYIFNHHGLKPIPAPCGHHIKRRAGNSFFKYLPSPKSAIIMHRYIYERLGLLWLKLITSLGLTDYA